MVKTYIIVKQKRNNMSDTDNKSNSDISDTAGNKLEECPYCNPQRCPHCGRPLSPVYPYHRPVIWYPWPGNTDFYYDPGYLWNERTR